MVPNRPRSKIPPLRFDSTFILLAVITALWLGYNYFLENSRRNFLVPNVNVERPQPNASDVKLVGELQKITGLGYPRPIPGEQIIRHSAYTLSYNEEAEQPSWVTYFLTADNYQSTISRKEADANFKEDIEVVSGSASLEDYKHSGYDRGHMAPAGDMKYNLTTYQESFLLSNVSPQNHELNTGLWRRIEEKVRKWQKRDGKLWVVTGPVLRKGLPTIGENKVAIPDAYFKILLDIQSSEPKMIGFYVANKNSTFSMEKFVVSIDKIEAETGLDFFYQLPDSLENRLEANITARKWFAN